jgi:hypothetical protein
MGHMHFCFVCHEPASQRCIGKHCSKYVCNRHLTDICKDCRKRAAPDTDELRSESHDRYRKKSHFRFWE